MSNGNLARDTFGHIVTEKMPSGGTFVLKVTRIIIENSEILRSLSRPVRSGVSEHQLELLILWTGFSGLAKYNR